MQITNSILMIRPVAFRSNEQTAVNNYYQRILDNNVTPETVNSQAQKEFDDFVKILQEVGVDVTVVQDTISPDTPDSIFPNNWISFHDSGEVILYPMFAANRRLERREDILDILEEKGFEISDIWDYTSAEQDNLFLEGTGSLVIDRVNNKVYCALSERANEDLVIEFCEEFEMDPVIFEAFQSVDGQRKNIYHTNVMMSLGDDFAIICADAIDDKQERKIVLNHLKNTNKEIITITEDQVNNFAGNMLQVLGSNNEKYLVMSTQAFKSLSDKQVKAIQKYCTILHSSLDTIEACGGGSARCMMAEVFLPKA